VSTRGNLEVRIKLGIGKDAYLIKSRKDIIRKLNFCYSTIILLDEMKISNYQMRNESKAYASSATNMKTNHCCQAYAKPNNALQVVYFSNSVSYKRRKLKQ